MKHFGIIEKSFKGRLQNHNLSLRKEFYKNDTELSKELWQIMMKNYFPEIIENYQEMPTIYL